MTHSLQNTLFDRYELTVNTGQKFLQSLSKEGCFLVLRDYKISGIIHKIIYIVQKIFFLIAYYIFNFPLKRFDPYSMHISVSIDQQKKEARDFTIAHGVLRGMIIEPFCLKKETKCTSVLLYVPKSESLRKTISMAAKTTAFDADKNDQNPCPRFTFFEMMQSAFRPQYDKVSSTTRRVYKAVIDILQKQRLRKENGALRSFHCSSYAFTILQASLVIDALSEEQKDQIVQEKNSAQAIELLDSFRKKNQKLHEVVTKLHILGVDARFIMPGSMTMHLDSLSS